jgi:hypothetical protein
MLCESFVVVALVLQLDQSKKSDVKLMKNKRKDQEGEMAPNINQEPLDARAPSPVKRVVGTIHHHKRSVSSANHPY